MKTTEEDRIRLLDIADSIREIQSYIGRSEYQDYIKREDIREAVSSQLLQIGGAAALLSEGFKENYGDLDWNVLIGLQYANYDEELELDLHPIWHIVHNDLPEISQEILDIASELEDEDDLQDVSLNDEDLRDLKKNKKVQASKSDFDENKDIHFEDEAVSPVNNEGMDSIIDTN